MSIITEMMDVAKNCVPEEVRVFHNWLGDVLNGKVKMADITQSIQGLSIEHIHMIAKCLVYKEQWMAIDMKTGEVKVTSKESKRANLNGSFRNTDRDMESYACR